MATLTINGTDYQAKCAFAFDKLADEKYNETDGKGNKIGGFTNIYMNLLDESNRHLSAFWDCGLAHLKAKDRPSLEEIENALEELMEEEGEIEKLFKAAFKTIDESGFYRKQVKKFWKNMESMKDLGNNDEQKKANLNAYEQLLETRENLLA